MAHNSAPARPDCRRLAVCLEAQRNARPGRPVTLTFEEVERTLLAALPLDAYERRAWWLGKQPARLLPSGWRVAQVDVLGHLVTFAAGAPERLSTSAP